MFLTITLRIWNSSSSLGSFFSPDPRRKILERLSVTMSPSPSSALFSRTRFICALLTYALPICIPFCLNRPSKVNRAIRYSALKRVSVWRPVGSWGSMLGFLSVIAMFFMTSVVKGLRCIFSNAISPSILSANRFMNCLAAKVCTWGSWIANAPPMVVTVMATIVSHIIFNSFLIVRSIKIQPANILNIRIKTLFLHLQYIHIVCLGLSGCDTDRGGIDIETIDCIYGRHYFRNRIIL